MAKYLNKAKLLLFMNDYAYANSPNELDEGWKREYDRVRYLAMMDLVEEVCGYHEEEG